MERLAFKMKLNAGQLKEYKKRHDEIWPELQKLLRSAGIHDYSIFFDEESHALFATMKIDDPKDLDQLPKDEAQCWKGISDVITHVSQLIRHREKRNGSWTRADIIGH